MLKILVTFLLLSAALCLAEDPDQYDMAIDRMTADLMDEAPAVKDGVPEEIDLQHKVQGSPGRCDAWVDGTTHLFTDKYDGKSWNWNDKPFEKIEYSNCRKVTAIDNDYDRWKQNVERSGTGSFETSWGGDLRNDVLRIDLYAPVTPSPTIHPTQHPTADPTNTPTEVPTTHAPSPSPSHTPTDKPTAHPTFFPTHVPTHTPTLSPTRPTCRVKVHPQGTVYETQDFRSLDWKGQKFDSLTYTNCKRVTAFDDDYDIWTQNVAVSGSGTLTAKSDLEDDLKAIDMQAFECHNGCAYRE